MFKSIRSRLTIAFVSLAIGPILVAGLVLSYKSFSALKEQAIQRQQIEAERICIAVEDYIRELERVLELTFQAHAFISLDRREKQNILEELLSYENRFEELILIDRNGKELIRRNRIRVSTNKTLSDQSHNPAYQKVMGLKKNYFSPVRFDATTGEPYLTIAVPLQSFLTGQIEYALLGEVRLKKIWDLLAHISSADQTIFIVDQAGNVIGHPDPSVTLRGQKFELPASSSGIATGLSGNKAVMARKQLFFGSQSINVVAQQTVDKALVLAKNIVSISLLVVAVSLLAAIYLSTMVIGHITKPLQHLSSVARDIQFGDLEQQAECNTNDEIGELGQAFNDMTLRLKMTIADLEKEIEERKHEIAERKRAEKENEILEAQLRQAHKMEAIGTMAGGIAHDFNNILAAILGYADLARDEIPESSPAREQIEHVLKAGHRAKDLVGHILTFSRMSVSADYGPVSLPSLVKEALEFQRSVIPSTITIKSNIDENCGDIKGDPTQLHQVLMNLCTNATHEMEEKGGMLEVSLHNITLSEIDLINEPELDTGNYIKLSVSDSGAGMPPELINMIFDPYFTTKDVGKGSGMGLAVVQGIVNNHSGFISVESTPRQGSTFNVFLPRVEGNNTLVNIDHKVDLPTGTERILFVDDEEMVADCAKTMLEKLGYSVTAKTDSSEALDLFINDPRQFDLVISDQTMSNITGSELAKRLLQVRPKMPIILCSGYSNVIDELKKQKIGIQAYAKKPVDKNVIARIIRSVLDENTSPN